jgi:hypothetical protein
MPSHQKSPSVKNGFLKKGFAPWTEIVHNPRAVPLSTEKTPKRAALVDRLGINI